MEDETKIIDDAIDVLWKRAQEKYGDPACRRPTRELEQIRNMLNNVEVLLLGPEVVNKRLGS